LGRTQKKSPSFAAPLRPVTVHGNPARPASLPQGASGERLRIAGGRASSRPSAPGRCPRRSFLGRTKKKSPFFSAPKKPKKSPATSRFRHAERGVPVTAVVRYNVCVPPADPTAATTNIGGFRFSRQLFARPSLFSHSLLWHRPAIGRIGVVRQETEPLPTRHRPSSGAQTKMSNGRSRSQAADFRRRLFGTTRSF